MFGSGQHKIAGLVVGLLLVGGIVGWTFVKKGEYETEAREELVTVITSMDEYPDNKDLFDPIVTSAHEVAFDAAYRWRLPGRRSQSRPAFRPDTYRQHAYVEIINAMKAAGREDLALSVERARARQ